MFILIIGSLESSFFRGCGIDINEVEVEETKEGLKRV